MTVFALTSLELNAKHLKKRKYQSESIVTEDTLFFGFLNKLYE